MSATEKITAYLSANGPTGMTELSLTLNIPGRTVRSVKNNFHCYFQGRKKMLALPNEHKCPYCEGTGIWTEA